MSSFMSFVFEKHIYVLELVSAVGCLWCTKTWPWFCFLQILTHTTTIAQIKASPIIPPITPPAIAPGEDEPYINICSVYKTKNQKIVKQSLIDNLRCAYIFFQLLNLMFVKMLLISVCKHPFSKHYIRYMQKLCPPELVCRE